jgi:hypothetical protein
MTDAVRRVVLPVLAALVAVGVVLAVVWLADGDDTTTGATPGAGSTSGSSGEPGSSPPGSGTETPVEPDPSARMSRFTAVATGAVPRTLDVTFWGGVKTCYRYSVAVEETGDTVRLRLVEKRTFDGACIDLAEEYERSVQLDEPLGDRQVVDAETGETLLAPA